jgi:sec-independent protein translocase protein TatB
VFDIGFTELLLCLVVALVVIGPEQLPGTVRTVALWIGRLKRSLLETRTEIERQIGADEIRRQLHNEEIMRNIEETRLQLEASLREHGVLDDDQYGNSKTAEQDQPKAADYGPPDELPDHAHLGESQQQNDPHPNLARASADGAPAEPNKSPKTSNAVASATAPASNNNQQQPAPAEVAPRPTNDAGH